MLFPSLIFEAKAVKNIFFPSNLLGDVEHDNDDGELFF